MIRAAIIATMAAAAYFYWQQMADASTLDALPIDTSTPPDTLPEQTFLEGIGLMTGNSTRGERNNNPGNIRISGTAWQGKVPGVDTAFETFATPQDGIRALAKLVRNYQTNYGLSTIRAIISRYAPSSENNTTAYINAVASAVGVSPDAAIDTGNADTLNAIVAAIIAHENGRNVYASSTIAAAVAAA